MQRSGSVHAVSGRRCPPRRAGRGDRQRSRCLRVSFTTRIRRIAEAVRESNTGVEGAHSRYRRVARAGTASTQKHLATRNTGRPAMTEATIPSSTSTAQPSGSRVIPQPAFGHRRAKSSTPRSDRRSPSTISCRSVILGTRQTAYRPGLAVGSSVNVRCQSANSSVGSQFNPMIQISRRSSASYQYRDPRIEDEVRQPARTTIPPSLFEL